MLKKNILGDFGHLEFKGEIARFREIHIFEHNSPLKLLHDEEISHEEMRLKYYKNHFRRFLYFRYLGGKSLNFEKFEFLNITWLYITLR